MAAFWNEAYEVQIYTDQLKMLSRTLYWRDGFYMTVNYSSTDYTMNIPGTSKVIVGEKTLKPAGVLVWSE